jgi:hypothetical protein
MADAMGLGGGDRRWAGATRSAGRRPVAVVQRTSQDRCDKAGRHDGLSGGGPAGDGGVDGRCSTEGGDGVRLKRAGVLLCGPRGREVGTWYKFLLFIRYHDTFVG